MQTKMLKQIISPLELKRLNILLRQKLVIQKRLCLQILVQVLHMLLPLFRKPLIT